MLSTPHNGTGSEYQQGGPGCRKAVYRLVVLMPDRKKGPASLGVWCEWQPSSFSGWDFFLHFNANYHFRMCDFPRSYRISGPSCVLTYWTRSGPQGLSMKKVLILEFKWLAHHFRRQKPDVLYPLKILFSLTQFLLPWGNSVLNNSSILHCSHSTVTYLFTYVSVKARVMMYSDLYSQCLGKVLAWG